MISNKQFILLIETVISAWTTQVLDLEPAASLRWWAARYIR
jgi:hypothetical protein